MPTATDDLLSRLAAVEAKIDRAKRICAAGTSESFVVCDPKTELYALACIALPSALAYLEADCARVRGMIAQAVWEPEATALLARLEEATGIKSDVQKG